MSRVTVRQLEVFHAILQTGSATRAAEALKISQPSVSKLLQELEKAAGLRLFERVRKRLNPTAEARRLGLEVEGLYLKLNRVERIANELRAKGVGELRVASLPALGFRVVPACLARFRQVHPEIRVVLSVVPSQRVVNMVAEARPMFALPTPCQVRRRRGRVLSRHTSCGRRSPARACPRRKTPIEPSGSGGRLAADQRVGSQQARGL